MSRYYDAVAGEVAQKTRELDESRRMLEQARARAQLPVLDGIRVASPCTADWNQMTGDDRTRHCDECKKNVYNLSDMTREEAEALLIERNGDLCVRYHQRHDGTILLADCTVGVQHRRRRRWIAAGAVTILAGSVGAAGAVQHAARSELGSLRLQELPRVQVPRIEEAPPPPPAPQEFQVRHPTEDRLVMGKTVIPALPTFATPRTQPEHQSPRTPKRGSR